MTCLAGKRLRGIEKKSARAISAFPITTGVVSMDTSTIPFILLSGVCSTRSKYPANPMKVYVMN